MSCESLTRYICQLGESEPDPVPACTQIGEGCYHFDERKRTWFEAQDECEAMGGILASPCKKQMTHLLQHMKSVGGRWWFGAADLEKKREYMYVKGTMMPGGFWNCGEPNQGGGGEDCVEMRGNSGNLNDLHCTADMPFICEFGDGGCNEVAARTESIDKCIQIGDSCYIIESEEVATWEKAKTECKKFPSGQLASPNRKQMELIIEHFAKRGGRYWIGATDHHSQGKYYYQNGEHMPGGFWLSGEPNQCARSGEDCVEIRGAMSGLGDEDCNTKNNYICEILDKAKAPIGKKGYSTECTKFGNSCFWINKWDELTWEEAKKYCEGTEGYLASPTDPGDMQALLAHVQHMGGKYWIGASDHGKEGEFKYVTGNRMIEGFWVPGEPNQGCGGEEDCIGIWSKRKGAYDENCDARLRFICQYGQAARQAPEPKKCQRYGTGCFIIETSMKLSWNDAKASCEQAGTKLAHPNKEQMKSLLKELRQRGDRYWIGGNDVGAEGHWTYVNGDQMPGGFWNCGEPNNCGNKENCVEVWKRGLNDLNCATKLSFVCQVDNTVAVTDKPTSVDCENIGSSCFMIEPDDKLTWTSAQKTCEGLGMTLAAPTNEDLQILLNHLAHIGGRFWIGGREHGSTFKFLGGTEVPCLWGPGYPEYKEDQKCVEIYAKYKGLADGNCETERNFICQKLEKKSEKKPLVDHHKKKIFVNHKAMPFKNKNKNKNKNKYKNKNNKKNFMGHLKSHFHKKVKGLHNLKSKLFGGLHKKMGHHKSKLFGGLHKKMPFFG
ncbi:unnamed protein product [Meganyctiphanes norvegica]|uniref:C-type lectin domain-containing protein n=1 Tax=Meganyctiphanes norvegica TaxID=48144 RepID=A0AAV2QKQ0_MEGNR